MKLIDINGHTIVVTNLDEAIEMAEEYKDYRHEDKRFTDFDKRMNLYWTDFYEKLRQLKSKQTS
ncbi:hypothetical protein [Chryseobacterium viscerum]|uniref:3-isopropylmalate dehydratase n=1 Tax=Chryseobacterium viscerum TaxID=1037377 RepID=A0A316WYQ7_9FLAO|nr:hypothetical protein [Chryseobacterium viscerum]PWN64118.1 hypothetical protein C1634_005865 [Chryseobacterium viscerum]